MHRTVNRNLFIIKYFRYKNECFYASVSGTLYAGQPFWFWKILEDIKSNVNVNN